MGTGKKEAVGKHVSTPKGEADKGKDHTLWNQWEMFRPTKKDLETKLLKSTPGSVGIHSQGSKDKSTDPGSDLPNTLNTIFTYGPQAASGKRGDSYWHQHTFLELTVGADSGKKPPEEILPMPPEETTDQDESGESAETDS